MGLLRLNKLWPFFTLFVLRVLFSVLFRAVVLGDSLFNSIVLLHADLTLFDLSFERLNLALVIVLLLDRGPEFRAWSTESQE